MTEESFAGQAAQEESKGFSDGKQADHASSPKAEDRLDALVAKMEKRLSDKDEFIEKLKSERRDDDDKLSKYEAEVKELREKLEALSSTNSKIDEALREVKAQREVSGTDRAEVNLDVVVEKAAQRMREEMTAEQRKVAEAENFKQVEAAVKEVWGDSFLDSLSSRCSELNISLEELDRLAKVSPKAAIELVTPKKTGSVAPTKGSVSTAAFTDTSKQQRPKSPMGFSTTKDDVAYWRSFRE